MSGTPRTRLGARYVVCFVIAAMVAWLCPGAGVAGAAAPPSLDTVTIEAARKRELKRQISHFVSNVVVSYAYESLQRWNSPVCPLVAGLPGDRGEFILSRVSQIAIAAHAPLAGEHCKPNLFIVVTSQPDLLLEKWVRRDSRMVNSCNGWGYVREFLHARGPVRVWYNAEFRTRDGAALSEDSGGLDISGLMLSACSVSNSHSDFTRLRFSEVQSLASAIILVDSNRTTHLNIGQLADYVAMVGLAQLRLDADTGKAPTILGLFTRKEPLPQGLSKWDESFLHALYTTDQASVLQVGTIETGMLDQIGR